MKLTIEKNVPIPAPRSAGFSGVLRQMQIGDSVLLGKVKPGSIVSLAQQAGVKVTQRKQDDGAIRVWRIA